VANFRRGDGPEPTVPSDRPHPDRHGVQRQELHPPKQTNLQFGDDTWERLLNAMERLEQVTEGFRALSATRLDRHADRDRITEGETEVRTEVHLQIKCLQRVLHPVREEGQWMIGDFLAWYAGRAGRGVAPADEYAVPIVRCILGEAYDLPRLEHLKPTEQDILNATEALAGGLHVSDQIEDYFREHPDELATQHTHERLADPSAGLARLASLDRALASRLVSGQQPAD
jgi:hypothetical protein